RTGDKRRAPTGGLHDLGRRTRGLPTPLIAAVGEGPGVRAHAERQKRLPMTRVAFAFSHRHLESDTSVIAFEGYLDLAAAPQLKGVLVDEFGAGRRRLVLDLSQVTFMDSTA